MNLRQLLSKLRRVAWQSCHRCGAGLMGKSGAHYCPNCLWDELEDSVTSSGAISNFVESYDDAGKIRVFAKSEFIEHAVERNRERIRNYQTGRQS